MILPGILPKKHLRSGYVTKADTIGELAEKTGIDPSGLADTIKKNNDYARTGKDQDFGKATVFMTDSTVNPRTDQTRVWLLLKNHRFIQSNFIPMI